MRLAIEHLYLLTPAILAIGLVLALAGKICSWIPKSLSVLAPFLAWLVFCSLGTTINDTRFTMTWYSHFNISVDLELTPLGIWMTHLVLFIGICTASYGVGYFEKREKVLKFLALLMAFMMAMLGLIWSRNLMLLFVFWECTSILSFLMVGFYHEGLDARVGARRAMLVTGGGGLSLLAGIVILGNAAGTYDIPTLSTLDLPSHPQYEIMTILIILGAFTKSAQFPFHFWLPGAMAAPTPASCYLHSATMVKAGVFLLAVLSPSLGGTPLWTSILVGTGLFTLLFGSFNSLINLDLKAILANSTFAVLGVLIMLIGVGTPYALKAMVLFLTGHAFYKATLFMSAGIIDHYCGTRELHLLKGLRQNLPLTSIAAFLAAISMSGLPGSFGFLAKEYKYKSLIAMDNTLGVILLISSILASAMMMLAALQVGWRPYSHMAGIDKNMKKSLLDEEKNNETHPSPKVEDHPEPHRDQHDAEHPFIFLPPLILASLGIIFGLFPGLISPILLAASAHIGGSDAPIKLWHGWNTALFSSAVTIAFGVILWFMRFKFVLKLRTPFGLDGFEKGLEHFLSFSKSFSHRMQLGTLSSSIIICVLALNALIAWKLYLYGGLSELEFKHSLEWIPSILCFSIILGSFASMKADTLFRAILSLNLCGFGVSMLFMYYGAPDLAITQITVDILLSILFIGVLTKLTDKIPDSESRPSIYHLGVAISFGVALTLVTLKSMSLELSPSIAHQMGEWSKSLAHGANVVNVILVDFRAMDTFAEITVLCICIIGVTVLRPPRSIESSPQHDDDLGKEFLIAQSSKYLYPVFYFLGIAAFWRGHQLPGGGFIGGLIIALALVLHRLSNGSSSKSASPIDREDYRGLSLGLGIALFSGLLGYFVKGDFFGGLWMSEFYVPILGEVHLGTPLLFDLGVMITVTTFAIKTVEKFMELD